MEPKTSGSAKGNFRKKRKGYLRPSFRHTAPAAATEKGSKGRENAPLAGGLLGGLRLPVVFSGLFGSEASFAVGASVSE